MNDKLNTSNIPFMKNQDPPEYKTWSLEKLQSEYQMLLMTNAAKEIRRIDNEYKMEKVNNFVAALKELLESD